MMEERERAALHRAKMRRSGFVPLHCWVTPETRAALRQISDQHGKTLGEVIDLGMRLARQHLLSGSTNKPASPAVRKIAVPPAPEPPAPSTPTAEVETVPAPAERADGSDTASEVDAIHAAAYRVET